MKRFRFLSLLLVISVIALFLRCHNISHGFGIHPDERHIVSTTLKINWNDLNPEFFAYGSFPFYLGRAVSATLGYIDPWLSSYDGMYVVGRWISVIFGVLTVGLTALYGRALFGGSLVPLLGALFLALNVFHLQLSRFFAFDVILSFFCLLGLYGISKILKGSLISGVLISVVSIGIALGTKISAISMFLPLTLALIVQGIGTRAYTWKRLALLIFAPIASLVVFVCVEPYAVLDFSTFVKHNLEQISMTRGDWRPPYTIQYWNTTPFLYPLYQMFKGTFGIPLFLFIVAGLIFLLSATVSAIKHRTLRSEPIILALWSLGIFISVAGLQVKFPRYLLPIYPILSLVAAYGVVRVCDLLRSCGVKRSWSLIPIFFVAGAALIYSIAFSRLYSLEHSYHVASRWIYQNIPDGSRILGVHWDDKVPVALPGFDRKTYQYEGKDFDLPIYERDTPDKISTMTNQIATSDYIAFPTPRIPGSIPRLPEEFFFSDTLLKLLYADRLGYKLEQTVKPKVAFLGFEWNDDLLDESFSVYDHPKVTIFKNIDRLSADEIRRRVDIARGDRSLPTREDILLRDAGADLYKTTSQLPNWFFDLFLWIAIFEIVGLLAWPLANWLFGFMPDRGYAFSKVLGVLIFGYLCWLLPTLGFSTVNGSLPWFVLLIMIVIAISLVKGRREIFVLFKEQVWPHVLAIESVILFGAIFWLFVRAFQPEIFWGEKVMDFGFFNFFHREQTLPPQDPWAAGHRMQYYYFGTYIFAMFSLLSGIQSSVSYNLSLLVLPLLLIAAAYGLFIQFTSKRWLAGLSAIMIASLSDYEVLRLWYLGAIKSFDLFWASSRVLKSPAITEYPIWSFIFGDLHAHVIALPFVMLLIGVAVYVVTPIWNSPILGDRSRARAVVALGAIWGSLAMMNSWDFITGSVMVGVFLCVYLCSISLTASWSGLLSNITKVGVFGFIFAITGFLISGLFLHDTASGVKLGWGYVNDEEFNALWQLFAVHGHWYLLAAVSAFGLLIVGKSYVIRPTILRLLTSLLVILLPIAAMVWYLLGDGGSPVEIMLFLSAIIGIGVIIFWIRLPDGTSVALSALLISAALLAGIAELFFLFDRMNTIFKVYNIVWLLFGSASLGLFCVFIERCSLLRHRLLVSIFKWSIALLAFVVIAPCVVATGKNVAMMTAYKRIEGPRPTLDGTAFIYQKNPDDYFMYQWLLKKVSGTPVMLEAYGISYSKFTRVQMNTGLPILLGWDHHVSQRGLPFNSVQKRKDAINRIYSTTDEIEAERLLFNFGVDLIVVSKVEKETYPAAGLQKFENDRDRYPVLFKMGEATVYATAHSKLHPNYARLLGR